MSAAQYLGVILVCAPLVVALAWLTWDTGDILEAMRHLWGVLWRVVAALAFAASVLVGIGLILGFGSA